jgi:multiple sugar transport system permease protein
VWSFGLSCFNYKANRARAPTWVGLDNYAKVLSDSDVWDRLHNTIILVIMTVSLQMVVGFLLALLFSKQFPLRRYLLILVLTPMMLSFVAVGAFFRYYYDPTFGLLSQAVRVFTGQPFILMNTVWGSRIGIVFADAWMWSPFVMLLVLAGLVSVPKYLYEAAAIDRVSAWRQFWSITFPYIRGLMLLALLFRTIEAFKLFDLVFLLTNGGPGTATETIALRVYRIAFENNKTERVDRACLHLALHSDRSHQSLSLLRQPTREGGSRFMTDMTVNAPAGSASAARTRLTRRLRFGRSASGIDQAGWGRTITAAIVSFIYFFPVFWIILTAFKTYEDALAVPAKFFFTPTLDNFAQVFNRAYSSAGRRRTPGSRSISSIPCSSRSERATRARYRHLTRLASRIRSKAMTPTYS